MIVNHVIIINCSSSCSIFIFSDPIFSSYSANPLPTPSAVCFLMTAPISLPVALPLSTPSTLREPFVVAPTLIGVRIFCIKSTALVVYPAGT